MTVAITKDEQVNKKGFLPIVMIIAIVLGVGFSSSLMNSTLNQEIVYQMLPLWK